MTPVEETRQRIIEAAAKLFGTHGYEGTSTRAIADEAGVNEVTLFRHFGNKKNLFMTMIEQRSPATNVKTGIQEHLTGDYREDLVILGQRFLSGMLEQRREILMTLCAAERLPDVREVTADISARPRQILGAYLQTQIEQGNVRALDPQLAGQAFFGMLFAFAINRGLMDESPLAGQSQQQIVAQFVDIFIAGTLK